MGDSSNSTGNCQRSFCFELSPSSTLSRSADAPRFLTYFVKFISLLQHGSNFPKERVYKQYIVLYHARVKIGLKFLSTEKIGNLSGWTMQPEKVVKLSSLICSAILPSGLFVKHESLHKTEKTFHHWRASWAVGTLWHVQKFRWTAHVTWIVVGFALPRVITTTVITIIAKIVTYTRLL